MDRVNAPDFPRRPFPPACLEALRRLLGDSRLAGCIAETEEEVKRSRLPIILLGHVGDGNFHLGINVDPASHAEMEEAEAINERLTARAIAMGGTSTGEHGIALGKQAFLEMEHGAGAVAAMRAVKRVLDVKNLMNPGKVVPG